MAERQAVVFIHGIGEQRPVDSLRGFMGGLFLGEGEPEVYTMPDRRDTTFELQVFVAPGRAGRARRRTDFYEGCWASEIRGTRVAHVTSWMRRLLLRWPTSLPGRPRWLWWLVWAAVVLVVALVGWMVFGDVVPWLRADDGSWRGALVKLGSGALIAVATGWVTRSLGDAVRHVDARLENVAVRRAVRTRIVERPLDAMVADRELPTCPPVVAERGYRYVTDDGVPRLHHAAPFAVVRWTNVYAVGDFIGGPVEAPLPGTPDSGLGGGVRNEPLGDPWARVPLRSHSRYWTEGVGAVRRGLVLDDDVHDLRRQPA